MISVHQPLIASDSDQREAVRSLSRTGCALLFAAFYMVLTSPTTVFCQPTPGGAAPDFTAQTVGGGSVSLSALRGKVVVLDFWATASQPSCNNMVLIKGTRADVGEKDLAIISVSLDKDPKRATGFANSYNINWPQVCDGMGWATGLAQLYDVKQIPTTVLIDRQGRVRSVVPLGDRLTNAVQKLASEKEKATLGGEDLNFGPSAVAPTAMVYRPGVNVPRSLSLSQEEITTLAAQADAKSGRTRSDIKVKVGDPAPNFSRTSLDLKKINFEDYRGKVVIIQIWASWHSVCEKDIKDLGTLNEKAKQAGLAVIGVSIDENTDDVKEIVKRRFVPWPQIVEPKPEPDAIREIYGFDTLPTYFLIDKRGTIRQINTSLGPIATMAVELLQRGGQ